MSAGGDHPLLAILGPTASGKTALSLALAERFGGEIVSCDSVAIYRDLMIGTAKPSPQERARAPHHMLDLVAPDEPFTAGDYARAARGVLGEITARGHLPIVAGGSGLYLRALLEGLFAGPLRSEQLRDRLRQRARQKESGYLHRVLARLDRGAAQTIHPNDTPKLVRAIEVCLLANRPMSQLWLAGRQPLQGFRILRLGLNPERSQLYARINQRARQMFAAGLIDEAHGLLQRYRDPDAHPACADGGFPMVLNSLGYRQAAQYLAGELTLEQAIAAAQQGHRNYAKRQMTWFRRELDVCWLQGFGDEPLIQQQSLERVAEFTHN
ncbi:MAG: tRNA (adenosine(37)-N6)-dimethylallyltransferase MiaA [Candidatus Korobacteraceae bacterium]|jgi:tRNA dimethylallyltransferase